MVMRGHMVKNRKEIVLRSSEVNEGQPEVSYLASNLLRHILFVMLLT